MTNEELAAEIQQGSTELMPQLWENTRKLFFMLCNRWWSVHSERFVRCGFTPDDLMQECYFVLVDAVAAFDSGSGFKLSSYFHYPVQKRFNALLGYRRRRKEPLNACNSIDASLADVNDDFDLLDVIPDPDSDQPFEQIIHDDYTARLHIDLEAAMRRKLNEQQKNIVYDYYFTVLPVNIIGEKYGVTAAKVKSVLRASCDKLRCDSELRAKYRDEIMQDRLYKKTGLGAFKNAGMSAVERTVEIMETLDIIRSRRARMLG